MNTEPSAVKVEYNVDQLLARLNRQRIADAGKRSAAIPVTQLAAEVGYSRPTVTAMIDNLPRPELEALTAWLRFFRSHGLQIEPNDLLRISEDETVVV